MDYVAFLFARSDLRANKTNEPLTRRLMIIEKFVRVAPAAGSSLLGATDSAGAGTVVVAAATVPTGGLTVIVTVAEGIVRPH